ncbi:DUF4387 domain-containing protein [Bordetella sp. BOR01]|uniref:DUF4387 domain-containing protein n=1 Tax=Bordetella sp. BOR01 TaxID=2854779 RepID=UPI001C43A8C9|nr:DUF4387 domain-containing protein [Bordetella sp. BOR01]MBV7483363.1 DUF4387 domain-containing protein [Bordetella sp. BOR01]
MYLQDIAKVIRSKNAGPRCTTLDIMFNNDADYQKVVQSNAINAALIARLYEMPEGDVKIIEYPMSRALKIAIPRKITAGDPGDRDVYGAQQHARLFKVEI